METGFLPLTYKWSIVDDMIHTTEWMPIPKHEWKPNLSLLWALPLIGGLLSIVLLRGTWYMIPLGLLFLLSGFALLVFNATLFGSTGTSETRLIWGDGGVEQQIRGQLGEREMPMDRKRMELGDIREVFASDHGVFLISKAKHGPVLGLVTRWHGKSRLEDVCAYLRTNGIPVHWTTSKKNR